MNKTIISQAISVILAAGIILTVFGGFKIFSIERPSAKQLIKNVVGQYTSDDQKAEYEPNPFQIEQVKKEIELYVSEKTHEAMTILVPGFILLGLGLIGSFIVKKP